MSAELRDIAHRHHRIGKYYEPPVPWDEPELFGLTVPEESADNDGAADTSTL